MVAFQVDKNVEISTNFKPGGETTQSLQGEPGGMHVGRHQLRDGEAHQDGWGGARPRTSKSSQNSVNPPALHNKRGGGAVTEHEALGAQAGDMTVSSLRQHGLLHKVKNISKNERFSATYDLNGTTFRSRADTNGKRNLLAYAKQNKKTIKKIGSASVKPQTSKEIRLVGTAVALRKKDFLER